MKSINEIKEFMHNKGFKVIDEPELKDSCLRVVVADNEQFRDSKFLEPILKKANFENWRFEFVSEEVPSRVLVAEFSEK